MKKDKISKAAWSLRSLTDLTARMELRIIELEGANTFTRHKEMFHIERSVLQVFGLFMIREGIDMAEKGLPNGTRETLEYICGRKE
jgi:hypothetical protein